RRSAFAPRALGKLATLGEAHMSWLSWLKRKKIQEEPMEVKEPSPAEIATLDLAAKSAQLVRTRAEFAEWRRANIILVDGHRAWKTQDPAAIPSLRQTELT